MKTIRMKLSHDSIQNAISELNDYKDDLNQKCEIFCKRLAEEGQMIAEAKIGESPLGNTIFVESKLTEEEAGCKALLYAEGQVVQTQDYPPFHTLVAVEFGAGIHYNRGNEINPYAEELGMGIGTFPDQKFAFKDTWWYKGNDDKWHPSHGVKATMPMYNAMKTMQEDMANVAKEVFRGETSV